MNNTLLSIFYLIHFQFKMPFNVLQLVQYSSIIIAKIKLHIHAFLLHNYAKTKK